MQNRSAVLWGVRDMRIADTEIPLLGDHEVLVEVEAVGVCGSDTHYYTHGRIGRFVVHNPLILGHEAAGKIVSRGRLASRHPVGARVSIEPGVPCGRCPICRSGRYNLCPDMRFLATPPIDGAFTRYMAMHEDFVYPVPDGMTAEQAALIEPLSVGLWACRRADVRAGDRVLVSGCGPVGVLAAEAARACGATRVLVTDVSGDRLGFAERHGFETHNVANAPLPETGDFDVLVECSGADGAVAAGLTQLAPGGRAVMVGLPSTPDVALPLVSLHDRELTVTTIFRYAHTWPLALRLVSSGRITLDDLVTHRFGLSGAEQALTAAATRPGTMKAVVLPQEDGRASGVGG